MPVERVHANAGLGVPHFQGAVGAAADDYRVGHLRRPHAAGVAHKRTQTLQVEKLGVGRCLGCVEHTFPVVADHTFNVLSSEPLTMRLPQNCRQVITWSSCPLSILKGRISLLRQFISIAWCRMYAACKNINT